MGRETVRNKSLNENNVSVKDFLVQIARRDQFIIKCGENRTVQFFKKEIMALRLLLERCLKEGILEKGFIFLGILHIGVYPTVTFQVCHS